MQIKTIGPVLLGVALIIAASVSFTKPAQAQQQSRRSATVILAGNQLYADGNVVGFTVQVVSASPGAPAIAAGTDLASALNQLREDGFTINIHSWGYLTYTATR